MSMKVTMDQVKTDANISIARAKARTVQFFANAHVLRLNA